MAILIHLFADEWTDGNITKNLSYLRLGSALSVFIHL